MPLNHAINIAEMEINSIRLSLLLLLTKMKPIELLEPVSAVKLKCQKVDKVTS